MGLFSDVRLADAEETWIGQRIYLFSLFDDVQYNHFHAFSVSLLVFKCTLITHRKSTINSNGIYKGRLYRACRFRKFTSFYFVILHLH